MEFLETHVFGGREEGKEGKGRVKKKGGDKELLLIMRSVPMACSDKFAE